MKRIPTRSSAVYFRLYLKAAKMGQARKANTYYFLFCWVRWKRAQARLSAANRDGTRASVMRTINAAGRQAGEAFNAIRGIDKCMVLE